MRKKLAIASAVSLSVLPMLVPAKDASAIPAFARKYGTSCYTCHSGFPARNSFGEAFRNNGYRWPGGEDEDKSKQEQLKLGSDGWKKSFPQSPWPGEIPGSVPFALWVRGPLVTYTEGTTTSAGNPANKSTLNYGTGGMGAATLFFGGTMGDNLSAFGQYNLTNVPSSATSAPSAANPYTNTALSGHVTWSFAPGVNLSFGNGFSDWTFGNAIQLYNALYPTPGTGVEFSYIKGNSGGLKITGGLAEAGTAAGVNKLDDIRYVRAKYKIGGAGLLSGAGGTYGNEFVGLDNHFSVGAEYVSARQQSLVTAANFASATDFYGADVTGSIGSFYGGVAYSKSSGDGVKFDNSRIQAGYFVFPWMQATVTYSNLRGGDEITNDPTVAFAVNTHLRANAYITTTYTAHTKNRITPISNTTADQFVVTAGFAF
ncbi:MAG: hypothetical protein HGB06_02110 [Chlorobaculum sp.]|nr:hypothetical protein [Chlorobaculum sp.]